MSRTNGRLAPAIIPARALGATTLLVCAGGISIAASSATAASQATVLKAEAENFSRGTAKVADRSASHGSALALRTSSRAAIAVNPRAAVGAVVVRLKGTSC